jgi:uncharacterized membrane protein
MLLPVKARKGGINCSAKVCSKIHEQALQCSGALAAVIVGMSNVMASYAFGGLLLAFFVSSSLLTRFAGSFKKKYDAEHKKGGQRSWVQVLCNGGIPSLLAAWYLCLTASGHVPFLHGCACLALLVTQTSAITCADRVLHVML